MYSQPSEIRMPVKTLIVIPFVKKKKSYVVLILLAINRAVVVDKF